MLCVFDALIRLGCCWLKKEKLIRQSEGGRNLGCSNFVCYVRYVSVSDVLASVEREERNVRLGEDLVIGTSVEGRKTSLSLSGRNESQSEVTAFAGEAVV